MDKLRQLSPRQLRLRAARARLRLRVRARTLRLERMARLPRWRRPRRP
jgi:hypothetical protein